MKMAQSFKSIVVEAGGYENVSFLEKDARNHVDKARRLRRLRLGEGDATAIQKYFQKMQAENDGFFFSLDLDEEGQLNNVFWADPRSRAAYKDFGDVVTFDTTYLTNKYDMLFAPFFVEKYEKAMESKIEKEWQANARCFSQQMPCRTNFVMEKQVEEVYIISKFQEFQQQLMDKMYCEVFSCGGSKYEVVENDGKSKEKIFQVIFERDDGEIRCACSMFECRGIVCRHVIAVLIHNRITFLPEKYIIWRWRKDVRRCYSQVKVSYDVRSSSIEHQRYKEECAAFYDVVDVASKNEESHKSVLTWIEKAMKDVSLNVRCQSEDVTVVGGSRSCTEIIQDPDSEAHDSSSQVATAIPTQSGNMAMLAQQTLPQHVFFPPYYQHWINYGGVHHVNFQQLLQQDFEDANRTEFSANDPNT
ncbi:protein FAR1-RELATED SEQUENCE [Citrus sinensis]|uniref:Protein FAR1-RELATED SEQUENCE n=1 Tax=Citrus sinensis TaxID=2711 RepID=A0ACB8L8P2_CITSI|nr:protein FAR1-RELATED SEQUENCE [Citrus sinensis]